MGLFFPWKFSDNSPKISHKKQLTTTTVYILTTIFNLNHTQVTDNITTEKRTFHISSSMVNITEKPHLTIRNKFLISLSAFLLLIILCIGFSYWIFIYLKHCLNMDSTMKEDISEFNRISIISSEDSNDTQLQICRTKNNILSETFNQKKNERHSLTDFIKLFRY
jgi:hypothetical protein